MLSLLSPAKSLDYDSPLTTTEHSEPRLLDESMRLIEVMRGKSVAQVADLMHISDDLATLNVERYHEFEMPFNPQNARAAVLAFDGDVYSGMAAPAEFSEPDFVEAQKTVRILSGLYGVLRPLDLMQPYRLEMGTKLATDRGKTLYDFWGSIVTDILRDDLGDSPGDDVIINLASKEYSSVVDPKSLDAQWVSPRFEDENAKGQYKVVAFYAKKARGTMARWLVQNRVRHVRDLSEFDLDGYSLHEDSSTSLIPVFRRPR